MTVGKKRRLLKTKTAVRTTKNGGTRGTHNEKRRYAQRKRRYAQRKNGDDGGGWRWGWSKPKDWEESGEQEVSTSNAGARNRHILIDAAVG